MSWKPPCRPTGEELLQEPINQAVANFIKRLTAYMSVAAIGGHFEHLQ